MGASLGATGLLLPAVAFAQPAAPITVTPPTLAPEHRDNGMRVDIPAAGALAPPAGSDGLAVTLGSVQVEGGFAEVRAETDAIVARLSGHRASLAEIYAAASAIEAAHARAGFVLARVSVPPQDLHDGGPLRIEVTDGFIEDVDVSGLPARVRGAVLDRAGSLKGRHHLRLSEIEAPLLIAGDVPGLNLRSTLMRGTQPGGTRLVLEGTHQLVTGSIGADNGLDSSLDTYGVSAQLAFNSALGLGEQIYGFVYSGYDVSKLFDSNARVRVVGGGMLLPLAHGRIEINPEVTASRTFPQPVVGAPQTLGTLHRYTLRANYILSRSRQQQDGLTALVEQIDEVNRAPDFGFTISHDRYMVARFGGSWSRTLPSGVSYGFGLQLSQGLGSAGAITTAAMLASGTPFSRVGADENFTKLTASMHEGFRLIPGVQFALSARGQTSFGKPVFRAEQFAVEGGDGASAYVGGITAVDQGAVARAELAAPLAPGKGASAAPYAFAAYGGGRLEQPTALEPGHIEAGSVGAGLRGTLGRSLSFSLEYAHGFASFNRAVTGFALKRQTDRVNFATTFRF